MHKVINGAWPKKNFATAADRTDAASS